VHYGTFRIVVLNQGGAPPTISINQFTGRVSTWALLNMQSLIIKFTNTSAFRAYLKSRGLETKDNYLNGGMVGKSKNH